MKAGIEEISESDFKKLELPILFEDTSSDRAFGVVSNGENEYKLGWQSTDIKPVIVWVSNMICSIGIDLTFIIFDFITGEILKKFALDYPFYDTKAFNGFIYIITELEIIKINISGFTVNKTYALPDYFESIKLKEGNIAVKCIDGKVINIK